MDELALLSLPSPQLRVFLALSHLESRWGEVRASMEDIAELTGFSRSSIHRAIVGLEESNWIEIVRTKRNYGLLSHNKYKILRRVTNDTSAANLVAEPGVSDDTSTRSTITTITTVKVKPTSKSKNTNPSGLKEATVVNRWQDDDDAGVVGLFENEVPASAPKAVKAKAHRNERPQSEWTAQMVASEFASRVYANIRGIPGMVNTKRLAIALSVNRKAHGITASVEMAAMDKFFSDERNFATLKKFPKNSHGVFLNAITKYVAENHDTSPEVVDTEKREEYIYASDGRRFDNSMPGRAALERYEEKIKG